MPAAITRIVTERRGGRTVAAELAGGALRPRVLAREGPALRVALVQVAACLLAGDRVALDILVGAGTALELIESAATIAHDARGGPAARWTAEVEVEPGGRLTWLGAPFVIAAGARVRRSLRLDLAEGAVALARDTLVLGRADEPPGRAVCDLGVTYAGAPLLEETFDTHAAANPVVAGAAEVVDTVAVLGTRPADGAWWLHGPGALRALPAASYAEAERASAPLIDAWRSLVEPAGYGPGAATEAIASSARA